jgi:hypothetical protein
MLVLPPLYRSEGKILSEAKEGDEFMKTKKQESFFTLSVAAYQKIM